jgi:hypothetical protein
MQYEKSNNENDKWLVSNEIRQVQRDISTDHRTWIKYINDLQVFTHENVVIRIVGRPLLLLIQWTTS